MTQECRLPDPHNLPRSSADPGCNAEAKDRNPDQLQAPPKSRGQACCGGTAEVDTTDAGETPPSGMARHTFKVSGLDCAEEVAILKREIGPLVCGADPLAFDVMNGRKLGRASCRARVCPYD